MDLERVHAVRQPTPRRILNVGCGRGGEPTLNRLVRLWIAAQHLAAREDVRLPAEPADALDAADERRALGRLRAVQLLRRGPVGDQRSQLLLGGPFDGGEVAAGL